MTYLVHVESNAEDVAELFEEIERKVIPQAETATISKTLTQGRTLVRKTAASLIGAASKVIGKRIKVRRPKRNQKKKIGSLFFGTFNIPISELGAKALRRGVSHRGPAGRVKRPSAFEAQMPSGKTDFYERKGTRRLPIKRVSQNIVAPARTAMREFIRQAPEINARVWRNEIQFRVGKAIDKRQLRALR